MASGARSTADRLNVQENVGPRTPTGSAVMRRSPFRHPLAELGGTAPNRLGGRSGENRDIGKAEPIYRMRSTSAMAVESRFQAAGSQSSPLPPSRVVAWVGGTKQELMPLTEQPHETAESA
jgi:hypothetical protein